MGNALVDVLVTLQDDSLLDEMSLPKGSMQLINEDKFLKISGKFSDMKTHKATGGSVGNTVLALANLGAHPGFIGKIGNDDFGQYFKKNGLKQGIDMKLLAGDLPTGVASTFISPDGERTFGKTDRGKTDRVPGGTYNSRNYPIKRQESANMLYNLGKR